MKPIELNKETIIQETEKKSVELKFNSIKQKWERNCHHPECGRIIEYKNKETFIVAYRKNSICRLCINKNKELNIDKKIFNQITKKWERICPNPKNNPNCFKIICHKSKRDCGSQIKKNKLCRSCGSTGKTHSEETKRKIGLKSLGRPSAVKGKHHSKETKEKLSKLKKIQVVEGRWINPMLNEISRKKVKEKVSGKNNGMYGKTHSEETKEKMSKQRKGVPKSEYAKLKNRERRQKELELTYGKSCVSFNINACDYLDNLSKENGWNLKHALNGGEIKVYGYWVDGYDRERNIVVEYDEDHHRYEKQKEKDLIRMNRIVEHLKCSFYRYNEKTKELIRFN